MVFQMIEIRLFCECHLKTYPNMSERNLRNLRLASCHIAISCLKTPSQKQLTEVQHLKSRRHWKVLQELAEVGKLIHQSHEKGKKEEEKSHFPFVPVFCPFLFQGVVSPLPPLLSKSTSEFLFCNGSRKSGL